MAKLTYKQVTTEHDDYNTALTVLYNSVARFYAITPEDAESSVNEYLTGKMDTAALLADIQNQLDWIGDSSSGAIADIDTAIAAIPGFAIPAGLQAILIGMLENQKRILQIEKRELKTWRWWIKNGKWE